MKGFPPKDRHTPLQRTSELYHLSEVCCLSWNSVLPTFLYFSTKECPRLYRYCCLSACYTLFLHLAMLLEKNVHIVTGNEESGFFFFFRFPHLLSVQRQRWRLLLISKMPFRISARINESQHHCKWWVIRLRKWRISRELQLQDIDLFFFLNNIQFHQCCDVT